MAAPVAAILAHLEAFVDAHRHATRQLAAVVAGAVPEPATTRANGNVFRRPSRPTAKPALSGVPWKTVARAPQHIIGNAQRPFVYLRRSLRIPNHASGKIRRYHGRWRPFDTGPISGHYGAKSQIAGLRGTE
jgi:hypothetical protein